MGLRSTIPGNRITAYPSLTAQVSALLTLTLKIKTILSPPVDPTKCGMIVYSAPKNNFAISDSSRIAVRPAVSSGWVVPPPNRGGETRAYTHKDGYEKHILSNSAFLFGTLAILRKYILHQ